MFLVVKAYNIYFALPVEYVKKTCDYQSVALDENYVISDGEKYGILDLREHFKILEDRLDRNFCVFMNVANNNDSVLFSEQILGFVEKRCVNVLRKPSFLNNYGYDEVSCFFKYKDELCYVFSSSFLERI